MEEDIENDLLTVMFRGTPCNCLTFRKLENVFQIDYRRSKVKTIKNFEALTYL